MGKNGIFRVAYTADFFYEDGRTRFADDGRDGFEKFGKIEVTRLDADLPEITSDQVEQVQGVIVMSPRVTKGTLANAENLISMSRFGVGYDNVDVAACTAADVVATITRGTVDRPVAEATVGWMIALSHHFRTKDRLVREGRWSDRTQFMGTELRDRTLGVVGFGGIGSAIVRLLSGFGMNQPLIFDPFISADAAAAHGVQQVSLEQLLNESDFVTIHCPLNDETRDLIGKNELESMRPTAYLINTARGGIVNEEALFAALSEGRIAGAALDCFESEPITSPHRFGTLENVLLAPHCIAWTHELFRDNGRMACQTTIDLAHGHRPNGVLNPEVFDRKSFKAKWERLKIG